MKKILFAVAAVAFTFASCGNKTQAPVEAAVDSTEVVAQEANAAADEAVANLTELLNGKDVNKFQEALDAIKAKAAELVALNPEIAKEYVAKVQNFLKENADKVKAFVGDNAAVNAAVSALTAVSADEVVSGFMSAVGDAATNAAEGAKEAVDGAVDNAKDAANKAVEDAKAVTEDKVKEAVKDEDAQVLVLAAKIESEIAELESYEERQMFLGEIGLEESGVNRLIKAAYALLKLRTFLTAGSDEVRAWTFREGMKAPQCAGVIHTDFERGFIRAEVIKYEDFVALGGEAQCRAAGKLGIEGKDYLVQDGDIMHFLFNV
jgi:ribosome-binding ATPase YchF (GTP1/OBG family)